MATAPATQPRPGPAVGLDPLWRMTVEQYHTMIDAGILPSGSPVELIEGVLVEKMSKKPPHRVSTYATRKALEAILPEGWYVDSQEPITLADSEPEPDVSVVKGAPGDYLDRHPGPLEVPLVVEVADVTIARDRGVKARMYARAGIPEYWLIDVNTNHVEVRTEPEGEAFGKVAILAAGDQLEVRLGGALLGAIAVADLLPR